MSWNDSGSSWNWTRWSAGTSLRNWRSCWTTLRICTAAPARSRYRAVSADHAVHPKAAGQAYQPAHRVRSGCPAQQHKACPQHQGLHTGGAAERSHHHGALLSGKGQQHRSRRRRQALMQEIWNEELYPLPKSSPCRNCPCKACSPNYYKKCTTWLAWFAKSWDSIQQQAAKAARI